MDWVVLGLAAALSVTTGILFGLASSLGASEPDLIHALRATGEAAGKGASGRTLAGLNVRNLQSVGQVAISIVLLIGAALLIGRQLHSRASCHSDRSGRCSVSLTRCRPQSHSC